MDSSASNHNTDNNEQDNNNSRRDNNRNNIPTRIFSPSPLQPSRPPSQPSLPFWNFISPTAPSISHQLLFHASSSTNSRPITYNNASALGLSITHRPWPNRSIGRGRGSGGGGINITSNHQYPDHRPFLMPPAPPPPPRRRPDEVMAAAAAAASSHFRSPSPPCTECGRRFPSSKALFGHMRCHPERTWRGINPPPNVRQPAPAPPAPKPVEELQELSGSEIDVVEALLFLATGVEHKLERDNDARSSHGEDNARSAGASTEQDHAGKDGGHLEEGEGEGEGAGEPSASSSSTMRYVLDLNLPPPPEDTEGGDGSDM